MLTYTDQISKIKTFPRIPYGSGIRENALAEVFFSGFRGLIFSQNWSGFHLSKAQVSSINRLKVMAYLSLPSFLEKKVFITASGVVNRRGETRGETWVSANLC